MSAEDPYVAPRATRLAGADETQDRRWRGVIWFAVPMLALLVLFMGVDLIQLGWSGTHSVLNVLEMLLILVMPAAIAGNVSHRRCRSTSWTRYLALSLLHGIAWSIFLIVVNYLFLPISQPLAEFAVKTARVMIVMLPMTLFLAATLRIYDRRRP